MGSERVGKGLFTVSLSVAATLVAVTWTNVPFSLTGPLLGLCVAGLVTGAVVWFSGRAQRLREEVAHSLGISVRNQGHRHYTVRISNLANKPLAFEGIQIKWSADGGSSGEIFGRGQVLRVGQTVSLSFITDDLPMEHTITVDVGTRHGLVDQPPTRELQQVFSRYTKPLTPTEGWASPIYSDKAL